MFFYACKQKLENKQKYIRINHTEVNKYNVIALGIINFINLKITLFHILVTILLSMHSIVICALKVLFLRKTQSCEVFSFSIGSII